MKSITAAMVVIVATGAASPSQAVSDGALSEVASARVVFGHQSVGWNIIDGIAAVYAKRGLAAPVVMDSVPGSGPGFVQIEIGSNGDPSSKFEAFERAVASAGDADVAAMKLCYVDIVAGTDVAAVFAAYRTMVGDLQRRFPQTPLVHVTVPLTVDDPAANVARQRYNVRLRKAYGDKVFDLARVESTRPNGSRVTGVFKGARYYALFGKYAMDEGHLNARGSRRAAAAFLDTLAQLQ